MLENDIGETAQPTQPVTLYITFNITPPTLYGSPASIPTEDVGSPTKEAPIPGRTQPHSPEHPLQPVEAGSNKPQSGEQVSPTSAKDLHLALDQADKAMKRIEGSDTWQGAVGRIKWVMDTLGPIAEVRVIPFCCLWLS